MKTYTHICKQSQNSPRARMAGFSLIEMMISITIGLLIIIALISVLTSASSSTRTNDRTTELQGNGRYALDHLKLELRHAGYRGYTWAEPTLPLSTPIAVNFTNECLAGAAAGTFIQNFRQGIWGANNASPFSGAGDCLNGRYLRGDVLVIRRVANAPTTALIPNTLYLRSTYNSGEIFQAPAAPVLTGMPLADFAVQEHVYYIGRDDNNAAIPALRRRTLRLNDMVDEMVVSGIEQMQVQYGSATSDLNTRYYNAGEAPDLAGASTSVGATKNGWDNVNSVRIWLLARGSRAEAGYVNTTINTTGYVMGDITHTQAASDSFHRQVFVTVVQLRN